MTPFCFLQHLWRYYASSSSIKSWCDKTCALPNYGCSKVSIFPQVSTNLKPPEGVAAVCVVTQKEASGLGGVVEQAFSGKALRLGDVSDLKQRKTNVNSISCCRVNSSSITSTHSFTQASQPFQTCCLILNPFSKQRAEVAYDFYVQTLQLTCNTVSCHGIFQLQYVQKRFPHTVQQDRTVHPIIFSALCRLSQ